MTSRGGGGCIQGGHGAEEWRQRRGASLVAHRADILEGVSLEHNGLAVEVCVLIVKYLFSLHSALSGKTNLLTLSPSSHLPRFTPHTNTRTPHFMPQEFARRLRDEQNEEYEMALAADREREELRQAARREEEEATRLAEEEEQRAR